MDLHVQTQGRTEQMRFLITDLGTEDLILGYPWLAVFEPKFQWRDASIDIEYLPIIIQSLNWEKICQQIQNPINPISESQISRIKTTPLSDNEKDQIMQDLSDECGIKTSIASQLAQEVQQYMKKVEIPEEYKWHWRVFSEEEAHQFPLSRPWDHAIELKEAHQKRSIAKYIPSHSQKTKPFKSSSKNNWKKGIFRNQSHHMPHLSSLSRRRMENYAQSKTIKNSMSTPLKTNIPYPLSPI